MSRSQQKNQSRLRSGQRSTKPVDVSRFKFATPADVVRAQRPTKPAERRYTIQGDDSGHAYFVEVGNDGEFERWIQSDFDCHDEIPYEGHNYEENRIDGRFTFCDPRCE